MQNILGTHMPFIGDLRGRDTMLFCAKDITDTWRSYYTPYSTWEPRPLELTPNPRVVECSPTFYTFDDMISVSVIADFRLLRYVGRSLQTLKQDTTLPFGYDRAGFVSATHIVRSEIQRTSIYTPDYELIREVTLFSDFAEPVGITRISYLPEDPDKLIVSGVTGFARSEPVSIIYSVETGKRWMLSAQAMPVYKCALYKGTMVYAEKIGRQLEDRRLVRTQAYSITPMEALSD